MSLSTLGDPDGVLIVDETGFLKKGTKSVGVQRQYSGTAGRRENRQIGVFLAYASPRGRAFLDRALYLPEAWAADADRRAEAGVPETVAVRDQGRAGQADAGAGVRGAGAGGVGGRRYDLRRRRPAALAGGAGTPVCARRALHARTLDGGAAGGGAGAGRRVPDAAWARLSAGEGSQGPRWYDWACSRCRTTPRRGWRTGCSRAAGSSDPTELAYYRACGPAETTLDDAGAGGRASLGIETAFEEAKGLVGLDQYEVRKWEAWYRHITLALLAHAALVVTRRGRRGKKKGRHARRAERAGDAPLGACEWWHRRATATPPPLVVVATHASGGGKTVPRRAPGAVPSAAGA